MTTEVEVLYLHYSVDIPVILGESFFRTHNSNSDVIMTIACIFCFAFNINAIAVGYMYYDFNICIMTNTMSLTLFQY